MGLVATVWIMLGGCSTKEHVVKDAFWDAWRDKAESSVAISPAERHIDASKLKSLTPVSPQSLVPKAISPIGTPTAAVTPQPPAQPVSLPQTLPDMPISLELKKKVEVSAILRAMARAANKNILISDSVSGETVLDLRDIPWNEAFKGILGIRGLTYSWIGDILCVMTPEDMGREVRMGELRQQQAAAKEALRKVEPLLVKSVPVSYVTAQSLSSILRGILAGAATGVAETVGGVGTGLIGGRGSISVDEERNSLIIQATASDLEQMIPLIEQLDQPVQQVLIECNIVEATRGTARELGLQWGGLASGRQGGRNWYVTPGRHGDGFMDVPLLPPPQPTTAMALDLPTADRGFSIGYASELVGQQLLAVQLSALQSDNKLNILSSPSVTTLDNQKAMIESGEERAYRQTSNTGNNQDVSVQWKKATLHLEVTPHVIDPQYMRIKVVATKDEFGAVIDPASGQFPISTKKAETSVILHDGQTTVIGGLTKDSRRGTDSGVPVLKDIPLLGYLFKGTSKDSRMDDMLIFITPHLLTEKKFGEKAPGKTATRQKVMSYSTEDSLYAPREFRK